MTPTLVLWCGVSQAAQATVQQPAQQATQQGQSVEALLLPLVDKFLQENLGSLPHIQQTPSPWARPAGCATIDDEMKWLASQNLTERSPPDRVCTGLRVGGTRNWCRMRWLPEEGGSA